MFVDDFVEQCESRGFSPFLQSWLIKWIWCLLLCNKLCRWTMLHGTGPFQPFHCCGFHLGDKDPIVSLYTQAVGGLGPWSPLHSTCSSRRYAKESQVHGLLSMPLHECGRTMPSCQKKSHLGGVVLDVFTGEVIHAVVEDKRHFLVHNGYGISFLYI